MPGLLHLNRPSFKAFVHPQKQSLRDRKLTIGINTGILTKKVKIILKYKFLI